MLSQDLGFCQRWETSGAPCHRRPVVVPANPACLCLACQQQCQACLAARLALAPNRIGPATPGPLGKKYPALPGEGAVPFVLCPYCWQLLEVPAYLPPTHAGSMRRMLRCGSCMKLLKFSSSSSSSSLQIGGYGLGGKGCRPLVGSSYGCSSQGDPAKRAGHPLHSSSCSSVSDKLASHTSSYDSAKHSDDSPDLGSSSSPDPSSTHPSLHPSTNPSPFLSTHPCLYPSLYSSMYPSRHPSVSPSTYRSLSRSTQPGLSASRCPRLSPSTEPSPLPGTRPSLPPSAQPSLCPSSHPSPCPSSQPSLYPGGGAYNDGGDGDEAGGGSFWSPAPGSPLFKHLSYGYSRGDFGVSSLDRKPENGSHKRRIRYLAWLWKRGPEELSSSGIGNRTVNSEAAAVRSVVVNGRVIPEEDLWKAEDLAGRIHSGSYWYDYQAGFWGVAGGPCLGILPPCIDQFRYPLARECSNGQTGILVNGRELHESDLKVLSRRGLPKTPGKSYTVEISGHVVDADTGEVRNLRSLAPTVLKRGRGYGMFHPSLLRKTKCNELNTST